jgi:cobalt/nickel transport system permease protein
VSTVLASIVCAGELAASGTVPWKTVFPAMAGIHALIGIGEATITVLVLSAIMSVRPELVLPLPRTESSNDSSMAYKPLIAYGLLATLGIALFVAPFASTLPDGLDKTAQLLGFQHLQAAEPLVSAPAPDYHLPGFTYPSVAGVLGALTLFGLTILAAKVLVGRKPRND